MTHSEGPGSYRIETATASMEVTVTESDAGLPSWFPRPVDQSDTAAEWMAPELYEEVIAPIGELG